MTTSRNAARALPTSTSTRSSSAPGRLPEGAFVEAAQLAGRPDDGGDMLGARAHFARIDDRLQALRPEAVGAPVPREPALEPDVQERGRVAVERREAQRLLAAIGPAAIGNVAGGAAHRAGRGQPGLEEEALPQGDGGRLARHAIARVALRALWPSAVRQNAPDLPGLEIETARRRHLGGARAGVARPRIERQEDRAGGQRREHGHDDPHGPSPRRQDDPHGPSPRVHSRSIAASRRSVRPPRSTSKSRCQRPGMWKSSPSAT